MLKKILLIVIMLLSFPLSTYAEEVTAAFVRQGSLWLLQNGKEEQVTKSGKVSHPEWSYDGTRLIYQREVPAEIPDTDTQNEIWMYNIKTKESTRIFYDGYHPSWAPQDYRIAFQNGRVLNIYNGKEFPVSASLTPESYADLDFAWRDNDSIIASRVKETEWSNDALKHPLPALYEVHIESKKQRQITNPPKGLGDYHPYYVQSIGKLSWFRALGMYDKRDLWIANPDGTAAREWLHDVQEIEFFERDNYRTEK